jgi:hypothetical protein
MMMQGFPGLLRQGTSGGHFLHAVVLIRSTAQNPDF